MPMGAPRDLAESTRPLTVIEVFADIVCPFTHVGLRRFVERREEMSRRDVVLSVKAWPLELVNGEPLAADFVAEEIAELRSVAAPDLFAGFRESTFPRSSLPALALVSAASAVSLELGERVSLQLRDLVFEDGQDVNDPDLLRQIAADGGFGFADSAADRDRVLAEHAEGVRRQVTGSPHFFTPRGDFFCPSLDVSRDAAGHLHVRADPTAFGAFMDACFDAE